MINIVTWVCRGDGGN